MASVIDVLAKGWTKILVAVWAEANFATTDCNLEELSEDTIGEAEALQTMSNDDDIQCGHTCDTIYILRVNTNRSYLSNFY